MQLLQLDAFRFLDVALVTSTLFVLVRYISSRPRFNLPPGPKGLPFIGNYFLFRGDKNEILGGIRRVEQAMGYGVHALY